MKKNINSSDWNPENAGNYLKETKRDAVYGPITSRRLGSSLGINTIQGGFACNWSCVYCQYGGDDLNEDIKSGKIRFTTYDEIKKGLEKRLSSNEHYKSITICGPTEPVLSPIFNDIVDLVIGMRDKYKPEIKTSLFTNATKLNDKNIYSLDNVFMKLDAGNEETFKRFNRAKGFEELLYTLRTVPVKKRIIQTAVIAGKDGNLDDQNLNDYEKRIIEIKPDEINLFPLLYKPFPGFDVKAIGRDELESLANRIRQNTGTNVLTFYNPVDEGEEFRF